MLPLLLKGRLRRGSGILSELDRGVHLVREALDSPRPLGHEQGRNSLDYCMTEGKPKHQFSEDRKVPKRKGTLLSYDFQVLHPS